MIISPHNIPAGKIYSRIISLVPSQTELLYDLGLDEEVIAITKFCVHPAAWHGRKARVGGTKNLNIPSIHKLRPDLIIANKEENVKDHVEELANDYDVLVTDITDLASARQMIHDIGFLAGKTIEATMLADEIEKKFMWLAQSAAVKRKIRAAYLVWKDPLMAAGGDTFINDMMKYCGLENIFALRGRYPEINAPEMINDCDLILLSSEPYPFKEKHSKEMALVNPSAKIICVDGEMFSWYGSRLLKAASYFADLQSTLANEAFGQLTAN